MSLSTRSVLRQTHSIFRPCATIRRRLTTSSAVRTQPSNIETAGFKPRPEQDQANNGKGVRLPVLLTAGVLSTLGVVATVVGLYEHFSTFSTWPKELREDLRAAIILRDRGDVKKSEIRFQKVLDLARTMHSEQPDKLGDDAILKISGISISLASMLELDGQLERAAEVYQDAWNEVIQSSSYSTDPNVKMRAVSIAQKLGDILPDLGDLTGTSDSSNPRERFLVWSVEELLRISVPLQLRQQTLAKAAAAVVTATQNEKKDDETGSSLQTQQDHSILLSDLPLPPWVSSQDLGASIESLGSFYASHHKSDFAIPLYLQSLSILLPPFSSSSHHQPTISDQCRAAILMNNLAQLFVSSSSSSSDFSQPKAWATKGLSIVDQIVKRTKFDSPTFLKDLESNISSLAFISESIDRTNQVRLQCLTAQITLLFNLGVLSEMSKDKCQARSLYQRAYSVASLLQLDQAKQKAASALARLERSSS